MTRRTTAIVVAMALAAAAGAAACFPDYAIVGGGADGSTSDSGSSSGSSSGSVGADVAVDAPGDATIDSSADSTADSGNRDSSIPPVDAGALVNMVLLDGGTFGFPVTEMSGGVQNATATITYTIAIDRDEVTLARFAAWVDAGMPLPTDKESLDPGGPYQDVMKWDDTNWHAHAVLPGYLGDDAGGYCYGAGGNAPQPTYPALASQPGDPLNCVSWEQALAFCWWDNHKRLPTETEWHVAATSRGQPYQYPWGDTNPPGGDAGCLYSVSQCNGTQCLFPVPVGFAEAGATPLGIFDLVGSVSEWNWDLVGTNYSYPTTPTVNYYGPDSGNAMGSRMFIESSWYDCVQTVAPSPYGGGGTTDPYDDCGFRCAKTLP